MMEEPNDENEVTLVLGSSRIKAQKDMLARNSLYFAALFSANFKDHQQQEFDINYDISLTTLQTFVNWANNEGEPARVVHSTKYHFDVRVALEKFLTGNHLEFLELLNFSVVLAAEKLTDNITEMIVHMRLHPDIMSEVWLLAEDLELKVLRDIAFASCLDRFEELSLTCILKLSKDNFVRLVFNRNINSPSDHMVFVIQEWKKNNEGIDSFVYPFLPNSSQAGQVQPIDLPDWYFFYDTEKSTTPVDPDKILCSDSNFVKRLYDNVRPWYMSCAAGRELDNTVFVWAWNGASRKIEEIVKMTNSQMHTTLIANGKDIVGRQVIGRAFSIYLIGGELGLGTGRFNTTLWRYCLFSKKWYIEAILPQPRRHMVAAFLKNKLYLFGGVGRHRLKLSSVDVYNIHTGTWSNAADIPETFTEVPASCVGDGKFFYFKSFIYIYDPISDEWKKWHDDEVGVPIHWMLGCGSNFEQKPVLVFSNRNTDTFATNRLFNLEMTPATHDRPSKLETFLVAQWFLHGKSMFYQQIWNEPWLISFGSMESSPYVEVAHLCGKFGARRSDASMQVTLTGCPKSYYTNCENMTNVPADCFKYRLGCFNIIDPQTLHRQIDAFIFEVCRPVFLKTCLDRQPSTL